MHLKTIVPVLFSTLVLLLVPSVGRAEEFPTAEPIADVWAGEDGAVFSTSAKEMLGALMSAGGPESSPGAEAAKRDLRRLEEALGPIEETIVVTTGDWTDVLFVAQQATLAVSLTDDDRLTVGLFPGRALVEAEEETPSNLAAINESGLPFGLLI